MDKVEYVYEGVSTVVLLHSTRPDEVVQYFKPSAVEWDWRQYVGNYLTLLLWEVLGETGISPNVQRVFDLAHVPFPAGKMTPLMKKATETHEYESVCGQLLACKGKTYQDLLKVVTRENVDAFLHSNGGWLLYVGRGTATSQHLLQFDPCCCDAVLPNLIAERIDGVPGVPWTQEMETTYEKVRGRGTGPGGHKSRNVRTLGELLIAAACTDSEDPIDSLKYEVLVRHVLFQVLYTLKRTDEFIIHCDMHTNNVLLGSWNTVADQDFVYEVDGAGISLSKGVCRAVIVGFEHAVLKEDYGQPAAMTDAVPISSTRAFLANALRWVHQVKQTMPVSNTAVYYDVVRALFNAAVKDERSLSLRALLNAGEDRSVSVPVKGVNFYSGIGSLTRTLLPRWFARAKTCILKLLKDSGVPPLEEDED
jgi:hypothetical protein